MISLVTTHLFWASLGAFLAIGVALLVCRIPALHPAAKTWICRLVMMKMILGLFFSMELTLPTGSGGSGSGLLTTFLLLVYLTGAGVVAYYGARAYGAASRLRRFARPSRCRPTSVPPNIDVREAFGLPEPCIVGLVRPALVLPTDSTVETQVIQHELAHVRHLDAWFGAVGWLAYALFWFVPGCGRLISEHVLWEEVWADLSARQALNLQPSSQARALVEAAARTRALPSAALGFAGDPQSVARRLQAMFVGGYSRRWLLLAAALLVLPMVPFKAAMPKPTIFTPVSAPYPLADPIT